LIRKPASETALLARHVGRTCAVGSNGRVVHESPCEGLHSGLTLNRSQPIPIAFDPHIEHTPGNLWPRRYSACLAWCSLCCRPCSTLRGWLRWEGRAWVTLRGAPERTHAKSQPTDPNRCRRRCPPTCRAHTWRPLAPQWPPCAVCCSDSAGARSFPSVRPGSRQIGGSSRSRPF
jgi:hypothetical protein